MHESTRRDVYKRTLSQQRGTTMTEIQNMKRNQNTLLVAASGVSFFSLHLPFCARELADDSQMC
jgi:hypothetical protein